MELDEFLKEVITTESGKLLVCIRNHAIPWKEEFHEWPLNSSLQHRLNLVRDNNDVYFSSHLFSKDESTKDNVLNSRTIQADLDFADDYPIEPSILVETSPNRFQGYWILKYDVTSDLLEMLSKRLTYSISNSDHSGWTLGHRLRLPGSLNHKYNNGPHSVKILSSNDKKYSPEDFEFLPQIAPAELAIFDNDFVSTVDSIFFEKSALEMVQDKKDQIPHAVYYDYMNKTTHQDRSAGLWSLMVALFESGFRREEVFWIAKYSVNNKFAADARFNANIELAKDVQRAEKKVKVKRVDIRAAIDQMRNMPIDHRISGSNLGKKRNVLTAVNMAMDVTGRLVKVIAGLPYFIPNETGRPIALTPGSEHFRALLHLVYGINSADPEYKYIHDGILDRGISVQNEIQEMSLSYFDGESLLLHTGRKDVVKVTKDKIEIVENATCGVLFPWHDMFEPFQISFSNPYNGDWGDAIFGDLHNTVNMTPQEARALLKCWLIFALMRSQISTRPILAFLGPPASGKSTIPHRIYALLYARRLAVSGVSGSNDFDMSSSKLPIYCIDNLDSYISWIIDKLAQAIGNIDIIKRKLFTDVEVIRHRRQAMLVVTAHNPKFTREDVTSRLLLITLREITSNAMATESAMISKIVADRGKLWASILLDVQKVLNTPQVHDSTVKWRIQDFASLGEWIATALGFQDDFNNGLLALLRSQKQTVVLQEELLTQALKAINMEAPLTITELWNLLIAHVGSNQGAFIATYKNPVKLNQKLINMAPSLKEIVNIQQVDDGEGYGRKWLITQVEFK